MNNSLKLFCIFVLLFQGIYCQGQDSLEYTVFLIGDAGDYHKPGATNNFNLLQSKITNPTKTTVVFLGDNIYPAGLAPEEDTLKRKDSESKLVKQLEITNNKCTTIFIPGNHDWNKWKKGGKDAVLRSEKFIENYGDRYFQEPSNGCPGPSVIKLTKDVVFIAIDSQWWLQKWSKEPSIHKDCEMKQREGFLEALEDTLKRYKNKKIILGTHHPIFSAGHHGGRFPVKSHIFPLTMISKNAYIPLPGLGSLATILRSRGSSRQEIHHPLNKKLRFGIINALDSVPNVLVASGHEHSLQHFHYQNHDYIVSGGGCKNSYLGRNKNLIFGKSDLGFAKVSFYAHKTILEFYSPNHEEGNQPLYQIELFSQSK